MIKRAFDIVGAVLGLFLLSPIFMLAALLIKLDSRGPVFFKQERIGKGFKPFLIYKFRTMVQHPSNGGLPLTIGDDPRITRAGRFLRKTKIDELPQLINVLKGEMTFVGPRPELRQFVDLFRADYEEILKVRPGITDIASLKYQDESRLIGEFESPQEAYVAKILPDKIRLAKEYVRRSSLLFDVGLILCTLPSLLGFTISDYQKTLWGTFRGKQ